MMNVICVGLNQLSLSRALSATCMRACFFPWALPKAGSEAAPLALQAPRGLYILERLRQLQRAIRRRPDGQLQAVQVLPTGNRNRSELLQMGGRPLSVEKLKSGSLQTGRQDDKRDL
jgi:hypothetical protein